MRSLKAAYSASRYGIQTQDNLRVPWRHALRVRQATGSGMFRAKEWFDGPGAVHRMNCGIRI
ncbi:MAG TPA: hypothetical protein VIH42_07960, partial [Thermoguttaceae bacterium]